MAEALLLQLSNQQTVQGRQALLVFGLQNDFIGPHAKVPLSLESGWLERIKLLVPTFRDRAGYVFFVRSEVAMGDLKDMDTDNVILDPSDTDTGPEQESVAGPSTEQSKGGESPSKSAKKKKKKKRTRVAQFLKEMTKKEQGGTPQLPTAEEEIYRNFGGGGACCVPETEGAQFPDEIQALIKDKDEVIVKSKFSAFTYTNLLVQLRMRFVSDVYLVGAMTNLSVYATAQEAASHCLTLNIVEDCLGYRSRRRHENALINMIELMGAYVTTSSEIITALVNEDDGAEGARTPPSATDARDPYGLNAALGRLDLQTEDQSPNHSRDLSIAELTESLAASKLSPTNRRSLHSPPQSTSASRPPTADASTEPQSPLSSKNLRSSRSTPDIRTRAKVRIRVRQRNDAELPNVPELPRPMPHTISEDERANMIQAALDSQNTQSSPGDKGKGKEKQSEAPNPSLSREDRKQKTSLLRSDQAELHANGIADLKSAADQIRYRQATTVHSKQISSINNSSSSSIMADQLSDRPSSKTSHTMNSSKDTQRFKNLSNMPSLGPGDAIGEGDSSIKYDLLPESLRDEVDAGLALSETIFRAIYHEVQWQKMYHAAGEVPRLVAVQGIIGGDGSKPVYRHPSDQAPPLLPFTKYVDIVRQEAEKAVGHPLNHALIQLYRSGQDYISEHSDKTLDILKGSSIVNASFGAQRTMRLRTKRTAKTDPVDITSTSTDETEKISNNSNGTANSAGLERVTQRIHMPHNSLFILGLKTNRFWLHGINQDRRAERDRTVEELADGGMRISLTFRQIGTFLSADEKYIWGQGARSKTKDAAGPCINADAAEADKMIDAFGFENKEGAGFDWDKVYGEGFDVLNMRAVGAPAVDAFGGTTTG